MGEYDSSEKIVLDWEIKSVGDGRRSLKFQREGFGKTVQISANREGGQRSGWRE
jgi:hypothetical protein